MVSGVSAVPRRYGAWRAARFRHMTAIGDHAAVMPRLWHAAARGRGGRRWTRSPGRAGSSTRRPGGPFRLELLQHGGDFRLLRQFGYHDPAYAEPFLVPDDVSTFCTDLASIPWLFAWLVPGLGSHLAAVLLHDGLVVGPHEPKTHIGPDVDRVEADRTPRIRRWLTWTGVTIATLWSTVLPHWWWRVVIPVTLVLVGVLGVLATLDVVDEADVLPWMAGRPWWEEIASGAAFALAIPLLLSALWLRFWRAGAIAGVALAFLLHVTAAVVVVYAVYWLAERAVSAPEGTTPSPRDNLAEATGAPTP